MALPKPDQKQTTDPQLNLSQLTDEKLKQALIKNPLEVLRAADWQNPKSPQRIRLARLAANDSKLQTILLRETPKTQSPYQPPPQPRPKPVVEPTPPLVAAEELIPQAKPVSKLPPKQDFSAQAVQHLQKELNQISTSYFDYYAKLAQVDRDLIDVKTSDLISSQAAMAASQNLWNWLKFQRGKFSPYFNHAIWESVKNALGPIGDAWRLMEAGQRKLTPSQIHAALDPHAIYRFSRSLENVFLEVLRMPFKTGFGILAKGGFFPFQAIYTNTPTYNPLTGTTQYLPTTRAIFAPFMTLSRFGDKAADAIDKWTKRPTSPLTEHIYTHRFFKELENEYKKLHSLTDKEKRKNQIKTIERLIDAFDGIDKTESRKKNFFRGASRKLFTKLARNLRRTDRDPLSYLLLIMGNLVWDVAVGIPMNTIRLALKRGISLIPGANFVRGWINKTIFNSPIATSARMGIGNLRNVIRAPFSLNAIGSTYLGYRFGSSLFPNLITTQFGTLNLPFPINIAGGISGATFGGLGTLYQAALLNLQGTPLTDLTTGVIITRPGCGAVSLQVQWTYRHLYGSQPAYRGLFNISPKIQRLFGITPRTQIIYRPTDFPGGIQTNLRYFNHPLARKFFGPGPISRFSAWLDRNPYLRLPIKGFLFRSLLSQYLPAQILSSKVLGLPVSTWIRWLPLFDYLWQIRGPLTADFLKLLANTTPGRWVVTQFANLHNWTVRLAYTPTILTNKGYRIAYQWSPSQLVEGIQKLYPRSAVAQAKPWLRFFQNFFNPGFFLGLSFISFAINILGMSPLAAGVLMPLLGTSAWFAYSTIISSFMTEATGKFFSFTSVSQLGFLGTLIGTLTLRYASLLGIAPQWWLTAWAFATPLLLTVIPQLLLAAGSWLINAGVPLLGNLLGTIGAGLSGLLALAETGLTLIGGTTLVMGITVISFFLLMAAFSSSLEGDLGAGPQSTCFNLQTTSDKNSLHIGETAHICSNLTTSQDLLIEVSYLEYTAQIHPAIFEVNLDSLTVLRRTPDQQNPETLQRYLPVSSHPIDFPLDPLLNHQYALLSWPEYRDMGYMLQWLTLAPAAPIGPTQPYRLLENYPQIAQSAQAYINFLSRIQQNPLNQKYLELELSAQQDVLERQLKTTKQVNSHLINARDSSNLNTKIQSLNQALSLINQHLNQNPYQDVIDMINQLDPQQDPYASPNQIFCQHPLEQIPDLSYPDACRIYLQNLLNVYQSWPQPFNLTSNLLNYLVDQFQQLSILPPDDPSFDPSYNNLQNALSSLIENQSQLIQQLPAQVSNLELVQTQIAEVVLDQDIEIFNPSNLSHPSPEVLTQIYTALAKYFSFFNNTIYFIPSNTLYNICYEITYLRGQGGPFSIKTSVYLHQTNKMLFHPIVCRANHTLELNLIN